MRKYFAEVLARERASLLRVNDRAMLAGWRDGIVEQLMTPQSPYALALRQTGDVRDHAEFLDRWRELIAETVNRVKQCGTEMVADCPSARPTEADIDAEKTAVLILAALHGGSTLSQLAQDPQPLNAALDLALVSFAATKDNGIPGTKTSSTRNRYL
jgi:hypothetical protein